MQESTDALIASSDRPEISVVIPVYDQPDLLVEALESVQLQSFEDVGVIVIDDGSDIDYAPYIKKFDDVVTLVSHDDNAGAAAARNTGIGVSQGRYVAFLDADDLWLPTKLEKQHAVFERGDDRLGLVYTGFVQYELDGRTWERTPTAKGNIYVEELERDRIHPTSTVMVRKECLETVGGFDPELPSRQDYDLWIRITEKYDVSYIDEVLVEKREQADSISKNFDRRIRGDRAVMEKVRDRTEGLEFLTRTRILSYHHHVLGRDYESNGDRLLAIKHLLVAILRYPFRPVSWAMLAIAVLGVDRNGKFLNAVKDLVR